MAYHIQHFTKIVIYIYIKRHLSGNPNEGFTKKQLRGEAGALDGRRRPAKPGPQKDQHRAQQRCLELWFGKGLEVWGRFCLIFSPLPFCEGGFTNYQLLWKIRILVKQLVFGMNPFAILLEGCFPRDESLLNRMPPINFKDEFNCMLGSHLTKLAFRVDWPTFNNRFVCTLTWTPSWTNRVQGCPYASERFRIRGFHTAPKDNHVVLPCQNPDPWPEMSTGVQAV